MLREVSMRRTFAAVVGVLLTLTGAAGNWRAKAGQTKSQAELRKPFIGTWRLVSITGGNNPGNRGPNPTGIIMYDAHGNMAVQIRADRPRPEYTGTPTPEQALQAMRGYVAYFGTYTIDERAGTVTHHRQGMLDAGAVDFVRKFQFTADGNRITLTPVGGTGTPTHLTWERVR
jgi:Lipocalin-like domain